MRKVIFLLAALTVILTGCRLESNISFDINEDASATFGLEIGVDDEFLEFFEGFGAGGSDSFFDEMFVDAPEGSEIEGPIVEGDMTYYRVTTDIPDLRVWDSDEFAQDTFDTFSYTQDEDTATISMKIGGLGESDFGDLGDLGMDPEMLTGDFISAHLYVTMPGSIIESNADRQDGTRLEWDVPLSGSLEAGATSELGGSGSSVPVWVWILIVAVVIIGIVAGIGAVTASKKKSEKAVAEASAAHSASVAETTEPAPDEEE